MTRPVFECLAWLFAPADDPSACALVEVGEDWRPRLPSGSRAVAWGRMPARHLSLGRAIASSIAREMSLLLASRTNGRGLRYWDVARIPPTGWRTHWQARLRQALMSGAIVRLGGDPVQPRVADRIAEHVGHVGGELELKVSGDGSALARITVAGQPPAFLRLATLGGLKDVGRNRDALRRLADAGVIHVPRLLDAGTMLEVGWSAELELPGTPVRTLSPTLLEDVVAWSSSFPSSDSPAVATEERLELIMRTFPRSAVDVRAALDRVRAQARDVPGVLEHGDLWTGNLLVRDGHLAGVVDWDNWHPAGVPGSDLLHLVAMARRRSPGVELGELWLERPWDTPEFRTATASYWSRLGLQLTDDLAWLVGVNWWAAHVTAALRRGRQPAADPRWVARNVDNVAPLVALGR